MDLSKRPVAATFWRYTKRFHCDDVDDASLTDQTIQEDQETTQAERSAVIYEYEIPIEHGRVVPSWDFCICRFFFSGNGSKLKEDNAVESSARSIYHFWRFILLRSYLRHKSTFSWWIPRTKKSKNYNGVSKRPRRELCRWRLSAPEVLPRIVGTPRISRRRGDDLHRLQYD